MYFNVVKALEMGFTYHCYLAICVCFSFLILFINLPCQFQCKYVPYTFYIKYIKILNGVLLTPRIEEDLYSDIPVLSLA